jgi:hypothetical protein
MWLELEIQKRYPIVYDSGSANQWNSITIGSGNNPLTSATIHYNSAP